ncbi:MAG: hypothetical protein KDI71_08925 [Xanthomonadales bacterium]|nr:hypothetical protein [Xanthomonadales bacterium]
MKRWLIGLLFVPLSAVSATSQATFEADLCGGGAGINYWTAEQCVLRSVDSGEEARWQGAWVPVHRLACDDCEMVGGHNAGVPGARDFDVWRGEALLVVVERELLQGSCDYADEQCTIRRFRIRMRVQDLEGTTEIYAGVGSEGS